MKINSIVLALISITGTGVFAGGISSGTPPTRQLVQCSNPAGTLTAAVSEEQGKIFGYLISKGETVVGPEIMSFTPPEYQGTPAEKPLTYEGKNMRLEINMTGQPVQAGQVIERIGTIFAKAKGKNMERSLDCKLFP